MMISCLDAWELPRSPETEGRTRHAWESTGLDVVHGRLCSTRRCVWCQAEQHKRYGGKGGWLP